jgi:NAD(P)H-hydrate epimerase
MRLLTTDEARAFDRWAIERIGVPSLVLMENAAIAVADAIGDRYPEARRVAVFCGPGNNGGDGFAIGRQLVTRGYHVLFYLAAFDRPLSNDASRQLEICQALGLAIVEAGADWRASAESAGDADLVVDALFGTGLARPLEGAFAELVGWISESGLPVVAVDLPSGLDAGSGRPIGPAVRADLTVTFGAPKVAHALPPAAEMCGALAVADLGVPFERSPQAEGELHLRDAAELATWLAPRPAAAHKGEFGHLLLVAGSRGMGGAAILAARAAIAGGAGRVTVATIESNRSALLAAVPEAMTLPLPESPAGGLAGEALATLLEAAARADLLAIGPGIGSDPAARELVRRLALECDRPLVLDADGLNAFAGRAELLSEREAATVLTPHPGELGRLLELTADEVQRDRLAAIRLAVERTAAVVVLKGNRTLVGAPGGEIGLHAVGGPALATAGSGDVLTGLLAARLGQGDDPAVAAALAVHLHGRAGDLAVADGVLPAVPARTLIVYLPRAFAELERG